MNESPFTVRRLHSVSAAQIDPLAALLIDCVEGGASVSFMLPLAPERAAAFWQRVADTVTGGDAERLYARLGWQRVGSIPGDARWPQGGACATTYFHRDVLEVPA